MTSSSTSSQGQQPPPTQSLTWVRSGIRRVIKKLNPQQFLCLDSAFHGNDQLKANAVQTFNAHNMQKEKHNQILFKTV